MTINGLIFLQRLVELSLNTNRQQDISFTNFSICQGCYRYERCWSSAQMEQTLMELMKAKQFKHVAANIKVEQRVKEMCIRSLYLLQEFEYRIAQFKVVNEQYFSRKLIGQQLQQMAEHFEILQKFNVNASINKQQLERKLQKTFGPSCINIELDRTRHQFIEGKIHVIGEITSEQIEKQLSQFFSEQIMISNVESVSAMIPTVKYIFRSAIRYEMEYDIYSKTSSDVSGDYTVITELEPSLQVVLVADGMGSGKKAKEQAKQLLFILRQCMQHQISPELTLLSLQYLLNPLSHDSYATLDMLLFDLKKGYMFVWKTGSMATYIVRGQNVMTLESVNAPIGTLQQSTEHQKVQLFANDYVFILTDGMFESAEFESQEKYLLQQLIQLSQLQWPLSAILYEAVERYKQRFLIEDDVTLMAIKINHMQYHWTTVKYKNKVGVGK